MEDDGYDMAEAAKAPSRGLLEHFSRRVIGEAWPLLATLFAVLAAIDAAGSAPWRWAGMTVNVAGALVFVGVGIQCRRKPPVQRAPEVAGMLGLILVVAAVAGPLASQSAANLVYLPVAITILGFLTLSRRWLAVALVTALAGSLADSLLLATSAVRVDYTAASMAACAVTLLLNVVLFAMLGAAETARAKSERLAVCDQLTGVANRRGFHLALDEAVNADGSLAVAYVDVDGLKPINDIHGHAAGDDAICNAAHAVVEAARGAGTVARLGGDEFAWLLPGGDDPDRMRRSILAAAGRREAIPGVPLRISVGAVVSRPGESVEALLVRADAAMYAVKAGRQHRRADVTRTALPAGQRAV